MGINLNRFTKMYMNSVYIFVVSFHVATVSVRKTFIKMQKANGIFLSHSTRLRIPYGANV